MLLFPADELKELARGRGITLMGLDDGREDGRRSASAMRKRSPSSAEPLRQREDRARRAARIFRSTSCIARARAACCPGKLRPFPSSKWPPGKTPARKNRRDARAPASSPIPSTCGTACICRRFARGRPPSCVRAKRFPCSIRARRAPAPVSRVATVVHWLLDGVVVETDARARVAVHALFDGAPLRRISRARKPTPARAFAAR